MDPTTVIASLPSLKPSDLLGLGGLALFLALLIELVKRTGDLPDATVKRFSGLFGVMVGIPLCLLMAWVMDALGTKQNVAQAAITGFLAGVGAAWGYDVAGSRVGEWLARFGRVPDARTTAGPS